MKPLARVPLALGNKIAVWSLLVAAGFAAGWVANGMRWASVCFPVF